MIIQSSCENLTDVNCDMPFRRVIENEVHLLAANCIPELIGAASRDPNGCACMHRLSKTSSGLAAPGRGYTYGNPYQLMHVELCCK